MSARACRATALTFSMLLLAACTQLAALDMHKAAAVGTGRQQVLDRIGSTGSPTLYLFKSGTVEYILVPTTASFGAMYSGQQVVEFIRFESDRVVRSGVADEAEEKQIREIRPAFVLQEWQGPGTAGFEHLCKRPSVRLGDNLWGYTC